MKVKAGQRVLLTGASGGLGVHMTRAFVETGARMMLCAHPGTGLNDLVKDVRQRGGVATSLSLDLRDADQRSQLVTEVDRQWGGIDILVNNAGVEFTSAYHLLSDDQILEVLRVNLEAPMLLTRRFLPGMLERKCGHIVNISSLAGRSGPAYQEPYAATKSALVAFTSSLRATYRGTGVSASAITPGFVEAGIYAKLKAKTGCTAPILLGSSRPETVARAVIRAIERNSPEIIINPLPVRPLLALSALFPSLGEWVINQIGTNDFFRRVVESEKRAG